jgi:hypothetical protein
MVDYNRFIVGALHCMDCGCRYDIIAAAAPAASFDTAIIQGE